MSEPKKLAATQLRVLACTFESFEHTDFDEFTSKDKSLTVKVPKIFKRFTILRVLTETGNRYVELQLKQILDSNSPEPQDAPRGSKVTTFRGFGDRLYLHLLAAMKEAKPLIFVHPIDDRLDTELPPPNGRAYVLKEDEISQIIVWPLPEGVVFKP